MMNRAFGEAKLLLSRGAFSGLQMINTGRALPVEWQTKSPGTFAGADNQIKLSVKFNPSLRSRPVRFTHHAVFRRRERVKPL